MRGLDEMSLLWVDENTTKCYEILTWYYDQYDRWTDDFLYVCHSTIDVICGQTVFLLHNNGQMYI